MGRKKKGKNQLFVFRKYKVAEGNSKNKQKHPKLIVESNENEYGFMGLTSSAKRGHHKNIPLSKNPQKGNMKQSHLRKEVRYDVKNNFGEILDNYNLSNKDKLAVIEFLNKRKKKK